MKPLGRKSIKFPSKRDVHPGKGYVNWWENEVAPCKRRDRQEAKRDIRKEIDGNSNNIQS